MKRDLNELSLTMKWKMSTLEDESNDSLMSTKIDYEKQLSSLWVENVNIIEVLTQVGREM